MATKVSTSDYRANLKHWHHIAASGEDVLVTDNDRIVVRVSSPGGDSTLDRLEREGLLLRGRPPRPRSGEIARVAAPGDSTRGISEARDR